MAENVVAIHDRRKCTLGSLKKGPNLRRGLAPGDPSRGIWRIKMGQGGGVLVRNAAESGAGFFEDAATIFSGFG